MTLKSSSRLFSILRRSPGYVSLVAGLCIPLTPASAQISQLKADSAAAQLQEKFGSIPLSFEPNRGQAPAGTDFVAHGRGYALALSSRGAVVSTNPPTHTASTLSMELLNAHNLTGKGQDLLPGTANYFIGNDPSAWQTGLPTYGRVSYEGVYPGIDLVYYGYQRELEYDFVLAPGADAGKIALSFRGASPRIDAAGDLMLADARFHKPIVYQMDGPRKVFVKGRYILASNQVHFALGAYDHSKPLVIDPVLSFLSYIGGSTNDLINGIAVDGTGSAYTIARSFSLDYPLQNAYQSTNLGAANDSRNSAIAVTKFNAAGTALVYSTYLAGSPGSVLGNGIAVDSSGNAYIAGYTNTNNYPITAGAYQIYCGGGYTPSPGGGFTRNSSCGVGATGGVLTKLNATGSALVYSTFLGGSNFNEITAVAVDSAGQAYVTGSSNALCNANPVDPNGYTCQAFDNFPNSTPSAPSSVAANGNNFTFVSKFNAAGSALLYSSILGDTGPTPYSDGSTVGNAIAVNDAGIAVIAGVTDQYFFSTAGSYQPSVNGLAGVHAFVAKFDTVGQSLVYSTFLAGKDATSNVGEQATGIAMDAAGSAYVAGYTSECSFPTTAGAYETQAAHPAGTTTVCNAGFVSKLNASGSALVWSTFLGNAAPPNDNSTRLNALALGSDNSVYVAGQVNGGGYPLLNPIQTQSDYNAKAAITRLNPSGSALMFSTTLGSTNAASDLATGIAVDATGNIYVAGQTNGFTLPVTPGAFQSTNKTGGGGAYSGFVAKIGPTLASTTTLTLPSGVTAGQSTTLTAKVTGPTGTSTIPTGILTFFSGSTMLGTGTLDTTGTATASVVLNATTYTVSASYPGDNNFSASVSATQNLVVAPATATVTLTAPATAAPGASVTLSVKVAATSGTPTGTVTFKDGSTVLMTATLASGGASYTSTTLAAGTHTLTASYSGDATFAAATSSAVSLTISVPPAITFAANPTTLTLTHGTSGTVTITGSTVGGYTGNVTFACGVLPASASCSFAPATLAFNATTTAQSTTLTFSTLSTTAQLERGPLGKTLTSLAFALLLLPFSTIRRRWSGLRKVCLLPLLLIAATIGIAGLTGCGGSTPSSTPATTPPGSYTVPVVVTAGTSASTINLTITVQ